MDILTRRLKSSYTMARMRYAIILAPEAVRDVQHLKPHVRSLVRDSLEEFLRHAPTRVSKSRIKRLRGLSRPQFRLRVGDLRIFYDVRESTVEILAVVSKADVPAWLKKEGVTE